MKQMKEQDLFEDLRDDSVLEYLNDYQENTAYRTRKIFVLMPLRLVRGPANFWGKPVIISMWWTTSATWG